MVSKRQVDRRAQLGRRLSIEKAIAKVDRENNPKSIELREDSKIRREIQEFIISKVREGKSREEILKRLRFVYGGKKYASYQPYFESWVKNHMRDTERTSEGEER